MNTSDTSASQDANLQDNDKLAQLLATAQPRPSPPAHIEAQVRAAVHAEWLHLNEGRKLKRQRRWLSAAAVLVVTLSAGWFASNMNHGVNDSTSAPHSAVVVAQLHGAALLNNAASANEAQIHIDDMLRTRDDSGVRVELSNGVSVRIAANTQVHWLAADSLQLLQGAVYVDSHANAAPLTIHTARGDVTHLGTRYLVEVEQQSLHVAVREGQVAIHANNAQANNNRVVVNSLQQVQLAASGEMARGSVQLTDATWQWADALAQPFALENHSVAEFLQWVANETGCQLSYANPAVQAAASATVLHGQVNKQAPLQALQSVLATTDFQAAITGQQLVINQAH